MSRWDAERRDGGGEGAVLAVVVGGVGFFLAGVPTAGAGSVQLAVPFSCPFPRFFLDVSRGRGK